MEVQTTPIEGLLLVRPKVFSDARGSFSETWNQSAFDEAVGEPVRFVQANESCSQQGVLRGLHFQTPPHAQGKLVRVARGRVLDVAVDLRAGSPTYGKHHAAVLTSENRWQFWVPPGFAHGFLTLEEDTLFHYLCTELYHPESEGALRWDDPTLGIEWGMESPRVSEKDAAAKDFASFETPFAP